MRSCAAARTCRRAPGPGAADNPPGSPAPRAAGCLGMDEHPSLRDSVLATSAGAGLIHTSVMGRSMPARPGFATRWRMSAPNRSNTSTTLATAGNTRFESSASPMPSPASPTPASSKQSDAAHRKMSAGPGDTASSSMRSLIQTASTPRGCNGSAARSIQPTPISSSSLRPCTASPRSGPADHRPAGAADPRSSADGYAAYGGCATSLRSQQPYLILRMINSVLCLPARRTGPSARDSAAGIRAGEHKTC